MKKIFISHSSLDKDIVDAFIDKILVLGLNIQLQDIACTSREDTGPMTGGDIRDFIKENISNCDFVFFMISENYHKSSICLNEMGAAWATDRIVKPLVFPNITFDSIGWLYNVRKGIMITDSFALDALYDDINEKYNNRIKISTWNKQKNDFIEFIKSIFIANALSLVSSEYVDDIEFDMLDYRGFFDENIVIYTESLDRVTTALHAHTSETNKSAKKLSNVQHTGAFSQVRPILLQQARNNDTLVSLFEKEFPILEESFQKAINASIKLQEMADDDDVTNENQQAVKGLIDAMKESLDSSIEYKTTLENDKTNLDKTHSKSRNKLIKCVSKMIEITKSNIEKANELLIYI